MPNGSVEIARIFRVGAKIGDTGEIVFVESFFPDLAAVGGFVNAARRARSRDGENWMPDDADDDNLWIARIDEDGRNVVCIGEADVGPRGTSVAGFVDAIAGRLFAGADVNDAGIRTRNSDCADGRDVLAIENRFPDLAAVGCFPDTAARRAHIKDGGIAGDSGDGRNAARALRSDEAPNPSRMARRV